jgi:hypothetical protein
MTPTLIDPTRFHTLKIEVYLDGFLSARRRRIPTDRSKDDTATSTTMEMKLLFNIPPVPV